jgi:predicted transcriptional regulator
MKKSSTKNSGFLHELGISSGAESVYMSLVHEGPLLVSEVSSQTKQFRTDVYKHIKELMLHELIVAVSYGKRRKYEAVSPEIIYSILKKKESKIIESVTELTKVFDSNKNDFQLEVFSGKDGIKSLFDSMVTNAKKNAKLLRIESPNNYRTLKNYYPKSYWKRASMQLGGDIEKFVITNPLTATTRQQRLNRTSRAIPSKYLPFNFNLTTLIIDNKTAFIDFEYEKAFLIKDDRFSEYMSSIFWMLYGFLK